MDRENIESRSSSIIFCLSHWFSSCAPSVFWLWGTWGTGGTHSSPAILANTVIMSLSDRQEMLIKMTWSYTETLILNVFAYEHAHWMWTCMGTEVLGTICLSIELLVFWYLDRTCKLKKEKHCIFMWYLRLFAFSFFLFRKLKAFSSGT